MFNRQWRQSGAGWLGIAFLLVVMGALIGLFISARFEVTPLLRATNTPPKIPGMDPSEQPFVQIAKFATPAVVNISTTKVYRDRQAPSPFMDPFFKDFFGEDFFRRFQHPRQRKEQSLGSGVIVSADGYIVTNNHVVEKADEIRVLLADRREFKGKLVGADPKTDIAVIHIDDGSLPTLPLGDSERLQVGEYVLAIGNPFALSSTVTMGIVSAVGRANVGVADYEDFIQTDAAINPGNSGGALVNMRGELIGINTAIFSRSGGYQGIGFAVPANMVKSVMESLINKGKVVRGWLGVSIQEISPELAKQFKLKALRGALVADVIAGSPAEKAGIKQGDVITTLNGKEVDDVSQLRNNIARTAVGSRVKLGVLREGKEITIEVTIAELPKDIASRGEVEQPQDEENDMDVLGLSGLQVHALTPEIGQELGIRKGEKGVVVVEVMQESPAEAAGLRQGDVIQEVNRVRIDGLKSYRDQVKKIKNGDTVLLLISRAGSRLFVTIRAGG
ncbi:MAG: DegQ family serine endoprotease [Nitrospirota bacterium]|nr:DegQ family serine endoprotease [Nitrospirota bacterium]